MRLSATYLLLLMPALLCLPLQVAAQETMFAQIGNAPMYINPAFAGSTNDLRLALSHRNEWKPGKHASFVGADGYVPGISGGLGVALLHSHRKHLRTDSQLEVMYSYKTKLRQKAMLSFGIKLLAAQRLREWHTPIDVPSNDQAFLVPPDDGWHRKLHGSSSVGVLLNTNAQYLGVAFQNIVRGNRAVWAGSDYAPRTLALQGGYSWKKHETARFSLSGHGVLLLAKCRSSLRMNALAQYRWAQLGVGKVFGGKHYILKAGIATRRFRVGYSYDLEQRAQEWNRFGAVHELAIQYRLRTGRQRNHQPTELVLTQEPTQ